MLISNRHRHAISRVNRIDCWLRVYFYFSTLCSFEFCTKYLCAMADSSSVLSLEDWKKRWSDKQTGWHRELPHELLVSCYDKFIGSSGVKNGKIFMPLCGKSVDIKWLADKGLSVDGVEIDESAILQFFGDFDLKFEKKTISGDVTVFESPEARIRMFQCDLFKFSETVSGCRYDFIWDRASYVAINVDKRSEYVSIMKNVLNENGKILLSAINYDPELIKGPPHYVTPEDVTTHFGVFFKCEHLDDMKIVEEKKVEEKPVTIVESLYLMRLKN